MKIQREIQKLLDRLFDSSDDDINIPGYSYYAFISYTEKDEKWAEWLQWELEHYNIPAKVRSEHKELPERIRPVFWYKNDLAGAHLSGAIKKELEQSKYMIVVCSSVSAKKDWVNEEVRIFKDELGRGNRIIPFVVEGEIKSNNQDLECLPIPLRDLPREKELRSIDVREYGKNKALVNIVSTLLEIRFDVLWNRFKREQLKNRAISATICFLLAFVLFGCWDYFFHTKYDYFIDMADCNGMPTGIIQVSDDEANNHYRLYRFEKRRGLLRRVVYVDCNGNPQDHTNTELAERPCIQELIYNGNELTAIKCKNATEKTLYIMHLSKDKLAADLKDEDESQAANFIYSSTSVDQGMLLLQQSSFLDRVMRSPSKIGRYIYERDEDGYIIKKIYARHNGDNDDISMDANGISGFEYERDSLHRVVRIRFLDNNYEYTSNTIGVAGKRYKYDEYGNLNIAEYVDKDGKLKYNELHWAKSVDIYDSNGYCIDERVFGADGEPCISACGFHRMRVSTIKNRETISYFDIKGNPTYTLPLGQDPGGYSMITKIRNDLGQVVEIQYKDAEGELCFNQHHIAINRIEYDNNGLATNVCNYDVDDKPCSNIYGIFREHISYNHKGDILEAAFYNVNEKPIQNNLGIHKIKFVYDNLGYRVTEAHAYNIESLPANNQLFNGAAWVKFNYRGSSRWVSELLFFGIDNKPFETNVGAKVSCERDTYGQIIKYKYYDEDYKLSSNASHCAIMRLEYNKMGLVTNRSFYNENNNPTTQLGVFRVSISYTRTGRIETVCMYDTLQLLQNGPQGWAIQKCEYKNGVMTSNSFYGEDKEPIEILGVHKYIYEIDESGYHLSQSAFNKDLNPTINTQIGAHKVVNLYDDNKRNIGLDYYNTTNSEPFVRIRLKLNQRGLQTEVKSYNAQMELIESPLNNGVATVKYEYDYQDRITYTCATDAQGKKMNNSYGFAETYFSYENDVYETVCLNSQGEIVNNNSIIEPTAYMIFYMTETGQRLFGKTIKRSYDNELETVREAYCYDPLKQYVLLAIQCEDWYIQVYDASKNMKYSFFSFEDEYDKYVHIVDSIQQDVEEEYGAPKFNKYLK